MRTVIQRVDSYVDENGFIEFNEIESTYDKAEEICSIKLDRRKNYCIIDNDVFESATWVQECSGCNGGKCNECGHTGKRVMSMWVPVGANK